MTSFAEGFSELDDDVIPILPESVSATDNSAQHNGIAQTQSKPDNIWDQVKAFQQSMSYSPAASTRPVDVFDRMAQQRAVASPAAMIIPSEEPLPQQLYQSHVARSQHHPMAGHSRPLPVPAATYRSSAFPSILPSIPRISGSNAKVASTFNAARPTGQVIDLTSDDDSTTSKTLKEDSDDDVKLIRSSLPTSLAVPDVQFNDAPQLLGEIEIKVLVMTPLAELACRDDQTTQTAPPLVCSLHRQITPQAMPASAQGRSSSKETVWVISSESGHQLGTLCPTAAAALGPVIGGRPCFSGLVRFKPFLKRLDPDTKPMILSLFVLVFATPAFIKALSDHLFKHNLILHPPSVPYHGPERYNNPHSIQLQIGEAERRRHAILQGLSGTGGPTQQYPVWKQNTKPAEEQKREQVEQVFAKMNSGADLESVEPSSLVKTAMYPHQKQALAFLIDREQLKQLPPKGCSDDESYVGLWRLSREQPAYWINVITGMSVAFSALRPQMPPQCRGAILADDMGLGKTIVIISLIAHTIEEARAWPENNTMELGVSEATLGTFDALKLHPVSKKQDAESASQKFTTNLPFATPHFPSFAKKKKKGPGKKELKREEADERRKGRLVCRSRATLIICPLSTVQNWETQIKEHTVPNSLKVYVYHGPGRISDPNLLLDNDVVITTFSTLGTEYSKMERAAESDPSSGPDSDVEPVDADGEPLNKKPKKRKRKKPSDMGACTSCLQQIEWFRIVLDEAHIIKEHSTIQSRAACDLSAQRRVCLSGTPLQNSLNDLFSLVKFLQLEPFTDRAIWTHYIGGPAKTGDKLGISRLQLLVRHVALRRSKDSKDTQGAPILTLPSKKDSLIYLELDEEEKAFYANHHMRYKSDFLKHAQNDTLSQNYASILQELLRLRQICVHMALVRDSEDAKHAGMVGDDDPVALIQKHGISKSRAFALWTFFRDSGSAQCAECGWDCCEAIEDVPPESTVDLFDADGNSAAAKKKARKGTTTGTSTPTTPLEGPTIVITKCTHLYCIKCFKKHVCAKFGVEALTAQDRTTCGICKADLTTVLDTVPFTRSEMAQVALDAGSQCTSTNAAKKTRQVEHSTKIRVLMQDLLPFSQTNPASANYVPEFGNDPSQVDVNSVDSVDLPVKGQATKSVIFSQWTKLLDRIADGLDECHIKYDRLDGAMRREDRNRAMERFREDPACEVLLVSLRAGGVGLNLTMASRVYLMEPFWNPAVENQATDRIHRLGQQRPVKITRYIVKQSIEENMLEIQKRKMELASMSVGQTLSKAELAQRRLEDLKILFRD